MSAQPAAATHAEFQTGDAALLADGRRGYVIRRYFTITHKGQSRLDGYAVMLAGGVQAFARPSHIYLP